MRYATFTVQSVARPSLTSTRERCAECSRACLRRLYRDATGRSFAISPGRTAEQTEIGKVGACSRSASRRDWEETEKPTQFEPRREELAPEAVR